jgi:hypothetical protein
MYNQERLKLPRYYGPDIKKKKKNTVEREGSRLGLISRTL